MRTSLRPHRGMTLVEVCAVMAVIGIVTALAWPSHLAQLQRARRLDAMAALTRLQFAQERHRALSGVYSADLATVGAARSGEGLYDLSVRDATGDTVTLAARARDDSSQRSDVECRELTLRLNQGLADQGPSGRCWGS